MMKWKFIIVMLNQIITSFICTICKAQSIFLLQPTQLVADTGGTRLSFSQFIIRGNQPFDTLRLTRSGLYQIGNNLYYLGSNDTLQVSGNAMKANFQQPGSSLANKLLNEIEQTYSEHFQYLLNINSAEGYRLYFQERVLQDIENKQRQIHMLILDTMASQALINRLRLHRLALASIGLNNSIDSIRMLSAHLVVAHVPSMEISSVVGGKNALFLISSQLSKQASSFTMFLNQLQGADRLFVAMRLLEKAYFKGDSLLDRKDVEASEKAIANTRIRLNNREAEELLSFRHKVALRHTLLPDLFRELNPVTTKGTPATSTILAHGFEGKGVVYFWATWCGPCLEHINSYVSNRAAFPQHIFISLDEDYERWKTFNRKLLLSANESYSVPRQQIRNIRRLYHIESLPMQLNVEGNQIVF